ncbi:hypothetical protein Y032_0173g389 [Ancylostoma ceylanicum]|uniref:Uncharacterized protein n=1 Tax=Ancylostoma ceylanicum TaxID=53326 RepID=A0A016SUP1_9BILA|nr:hypothetical protein Y032_0173g389 [Ancylostoma ceylanicum]
MWSCCSQTSTSEKVQTVFALILFHRFFSDSSYPESLPLCSSTLHLLNIESLFYRTVFAEFVLAFRALRLTTKLKSTYF